MLQSEPTALGSLLDKIEVLAASRKTVSLRLIVDTFGARTFGPFFVLPGLILTSPLSGVPGLVTFLSVVVLLAAVQMLSNRDSVWLPRLVLNRTVSSVRLIRVIQWSRRPARFIDQTLRPRLLILFRGVGTFVMASIVAVLALVMPAMELIPFSATAAGIALTAFGLSLIAHDGLLALGAAGFVILIPGLIIYQSLD